MRARCQRSPTKAHHWLFEPQGTLNANRAICKYCGEERRFGHKEPYDLLCTDHGRVRLSPIGKAKYGGNKL